MLDSIIRDSFLEPSYGFPGRWPIFVVQVRSPGPVTPSVNALGPVVLSNDIQQHFSNVHEKTIHRIQRAPVNSTLLCPRKLLQASHKSSLSAFLSETFQGRKSDGLSMFKASWQ